MLALLSPLSMDLYLDFLARLLLTTLRTQMSRKADEDAIKTKDRARKGHEYAVSDVVYAAMQGSDVAGND